MNYDLLNLVILGAFLHCRVWSLCNQLLSQFSVNVSQPCRHIGDILKMCIGVLDGARIYFEKINSLLNLVILAAFCTIGYNQLLLQFLKDSFHTL